MQIDQERKTHPEPESTGRRSKGAMWRGAVALVLLALITACTAQTGPSSSPVSTPTSAGSAPTSASPVAGSPSPAAPSASSASASASPAATSASPAASSASPSATSTNAAGEPQPGGTFVMAVGEDVPELDPHSLQSFANLQIYEAMFRRDPQEYGKFLPALAESVDVSEDGLVYTLNLREGVVFHDGTPFDADAVVFNLERQAYPDNPYHQGGQNWAGWALGNPGLVTGIEAVDPLTVRLTLSEPILDFDFILADEQAGFGMISPAVIMADPEGFGQNPVGAGTGAFMFEERVTGDRVTLVRNPNYWEEGKPYLDSWILRTIPDPGSRLLALKEGDIQMFDVSGPEIAQLSGDPEVELITVPPLFGSFIAFDYNDPITGDPLVRRAISQAIDAQSIVSTLSPFAEVTPNFGLFPGMPGHRTDIEWYGYDPAAARATLEEAGYPDGVDLTLSFSTPPVGLNHQLLAQAIQGQMQAAGFRVTLAQVDGPTMFQSGFGPPGREEYPFQMALNVAGSDGDSFAMLGGWTSRSNYASKNPAFMELFERMNGAVDPELRLQVFGEMQQQLYDDVAYIPIAHTEVVRAASTNVRGLDTAAFHFHNVWLEE